MLATHVEKWSKDIEQRGHQMGRQEGVVRTLLLLLKRRFGPIPDWATAKLANADLKTLETWTERILDAESLHEVFQVFQVVQ